MSIQIENLHKAFGPKKVLQGFSVEAKEGETLVILGQSGSGKSVTIKHVVGLLRPDAGQVRVDGQVVGELEGEALATLRRGVGYVFQFAALFDSMTLAENVGMGLRRMTEVTPQARKERVEECLALVGLSDMGGRMPSELSGGQRKRAGIARAIATRPRYLLYDEPTTGLDPVTRAVIDRLINQMKKTLGVTGIVITHDMESAFRVADRMAMLYQGRCLFEGDPETFRTHEHPVVRAFIEGRPELMEGWNE
jgi:phospholipid/cholesterol/gamma-HCH transport system ATP-binding protein